MGRAPCCEKMGLKKGPWTTEEDQILIAFIQKYGHGNWRALPKQAGLLRCGKSCRLRWTNYLRPDIKRGNFSSEEEETIIKLHELLGNRWSAIAARLPGRTDNEIKNVWHTHLKKRLQRNTAISITRPNSIEVPEHSANLEMKPADSTIQQTSENPSSDPASPQNSLSQSSPTATESSIATSENRKTSSIDEFISEFTENYWSDAFMIDDLNTYEDFSATDNNPQLEFQSSSDSITESIHRCGAYSDGSMDFWFNLLMETGSLPELPEI